jgi:ssRNA-specific RNase YbeY (16S rRNA maturation enzyme)
VAKRPTSVNVMGVPFEIKWDHVFPAPAADEDPTMGEMDGTSRTIMIAPHHKSGELASTLMHELIHAVLHVSGQDDHLERHSKELEETIVRVIENGMFPLLGVIRSVG